MTHRSTSRSIKPIKIPRFCRPGVRRPKARSSNGGRTGSTVFYEGWVWTPTLESKSRTTQTPVVLRYPRQGCGSPSVGVGGPSRRSSETLPCSESRPGSAPPPLDDRRPRHLSEVPCHTLTGPRPRGCQLVLVSAQESEDPLLPGELRRHHKGLFGVSPPRQVPGSRPYLRREVLHWTPVSCGSGRSSSP